MVGNDDVDLTFAAFIVLFKGFLGLILGLLRDEIINDLASFEKFFLPFRLYLMVMKFEHVLLK